MSEIENPFALNAYSGPELFCDREEESARLISNARNGIHTTLLSIRRMGKTGLIYHAFHSLQKSRKTGCIYADIYSTQNIQDFTNSMAAAILKAFPESKSIGKKFMQLLKGFRPTISFDALSGEPEVSFDYAQPKQYQQSLAGLFAFLESQDMPIVVAIDEFQQVVNYPEKNTEALLRSLIQPLKNVHFIFSGSNKHMLSDIFSNSKRPFFSSTQALYLGPIAADNYSLFIQTVFRKHKRKIQDDALQFILTWSRRHTYYTQATCNRLFASGLKDITLAIAQQQCSDLLKEQENVFFQYRNLLTAGQWNLLRAIAREDKVYQPSAGLFISKHGIGTPANVQRALEALLHKEMVYRERDETGNYYSVYDCFLSRWLARL